MRYPAIAFVCATLCTACGGDSLTLPSLAPPGATKLGVTTDVPAHVVAGQPLSPDLRVQVQDAAGSGVKQAGIAVTAALDGTAAQLSGQLTQPTDASGVATFTGLSIDGPSGSYTIRFSSAGLTPTTTAPITVTLDHVGTTTSIRSISPSRGEALAPVTVSFTVAAAGGSDSPSGTVTVSDGSESCSATVSAASCVLTPQTGGDKTITVSYPGEGSFQSSRATTPYHVDRVATTAATPDVQPSQFVLRDTPVTISTRVAADRGSVQGTVVFNQDACGADGSSLGSPVPVQSDGTASLTTSIHRVGTLSVVACYSGTATFAPAASHSTSILVLRQ